MVAGRRTVGSIMDGPSDFVTMKDVAKACGVSVVTVSRALRGDVRHSAETCRRVREVADALGYQPNPLVAALMSARGRHKPGKVAVNLGLISLGGDWKAHPFYVGAVAQAEALGYSVECFLLAPGPAAARRLRQILRQRGVRGLIVLPAMEPGWTMDFDFGGFAAATIGHSIQVPALPRVTTDTYQRVLQALGELERRGYRRLGLLSSRDLDLRFQYHITAVLAVRRRIGNPQTTVTCLEVPAPVDAVSAREVTQWISDNRLDAVISQFGKQYEVLMAAGVRIPGELGYLHLHRHENPRVTQMDQMQERIGRKAADVVIGMINRNEFVLPAHPQTVTIPSVWREGETCPAVSRAAGRIGARRDVGRRVPRRSGTRRTTG